MQNLNKKEYSLKIDEKVKEELSKVDIPIIELPSYMHADVKTRYIGILNGFLFTRSWKYWKCQGKFPVEIASVIFHSKHFRSVRAEGYSTSVDPVKIAHDPIYEKALRDLIDKIKNETLGINEYVEGKQKIVKDDKRQKYIYFYHIDTIDGLKTIADYIKTYNLQNMGELI